MWLILSPFGHEIEILRLLEIKWCLEKQGLLALLAVDVNISKSSERESWSESFKRRQENTVMLYDTHCRIAESNNILFPVRHIWSLKGARWTKKTSSENYFENIEETVVCRLSAAALYRQFENQRSNVLHRDFAFLQQFFNLRIRIWRYVVFSPFYWQLTHTHFQNGKSSFR